VVRARPAAGAATLLEIGQFYPDPTGLAVLVPSGGANGLAGKVVCVAGRISGRAGAATIEEDAASIIVVN
jgi:hypothetical protein